jgi:hypothetical protein
MMEINIFMLDIWSLLVKQFALLNLRFFPVSHHLNVTHVTSLFIQNYQLYITFLILFIFGCQEKKKPTPTKPSDVKRTRRDRTEMENIIFKLFERQPNWALKALVQETDQPEVFFWLFPNSFYKHISTMDDLFFCSLRAHTVIVCPQLCAAISEGDTE